MKKAFAVSTDNERFLIIKAFSETEAYVILAKELLEDEFLLHYIKSFDTDDGLIANIITGENLPGKLYYNIELFWNNKFLSDEYKRNYQLYIDGYDGDSINFSNDFLIETLILILKKGLWFEKFRMIDIDDVDENIQYLYILDNN